MIWNYGLHWRADRVWWGKIGGSHDGGTLYGATTRNAKKKHRVDFRHQTCIYALYADYELVYVGQAGTGAQSFLRRLNGHRSDHLSERWNMFSWFGSLRVDKKNELSEFDSIEEYANCEKFDIHNLMKSTVNILEAVSIAISEPRLNLKRGNWNGMKGNWNGATQYYQWWDKRVVLQNDGQAAP